MSSVTSVIGQRPYRAQNFAVVNTAAFTYPQTTVESASLTGLVQNDGSVKVFSTAANGVLTSSGGILNGGTAFSGITPAMSAGYELRDMGVNVHVYGPNGVKLYTLTLVQQLASNTLGDSEGVGGAGQTGTNGNAYQTFYVVTWSSNPATSGIAPGVARV